MSARSCRCLNVPPEERNHGRGGEDRDDHAECAQPRPLEHQDQAQWSRHRVKVAGSMSPRLA